MIKLNYLKNNFTKSNRLFYKKNPYDIIVQTKSDKEGSMKIKFVYNTAHE